MDLQNDPDSWLAQLRFGYAAMNNSWNQWVLDYNPDRQRSFLEELGAAFGNWRSALGAALIGVLLLTLRWQRQQRPADPLEALYQALLPATGAPRLRAASRTKVRQATRCALARDAGQPGKTRRDGPVFDLVRHADVWRAQARYTLGVAGDAENTATLMPMKTLMTTLLLSAAILSPASHAAVDPYGYKLPPSMQKKKKAGPAKKKGPPPVDYVGEFVNFGDWKDVRIFLDDVATRDGFDRAELNTMMAPGALRRRGRAAGQAGAAGQAEELASLQPPDGGTGAHRRRRQVLE
jgi:hypothetical protein